MKPNKKLISLVRVLVKPEYQESVLRDCSEGLGYLMPIMTIHGIPVRIELVEDCFEDEYKDSDWNEYPKVKPPKHEPLRVEFADKSGTKAFFDDCLREYVTAKRIDSPCRYRPWED